MLLKVDRTAKLEEERRKEAEERFRRQEAERAREDKQRRRQSLLESLEPEPAVERKGEYVTCVIRLPCGTRKTRRLLVNSTIRNLQNFVETLGLTAGVIPDNYAIVVDYLEGQPKVLENLDETLIETGLAKFSSFTARIEELYDNKEEAEAK